jgi:hypothetical protein
VSSLVLQVGANNPTPEKYIVTQSPDPMVEDHGRDQDPNRVVAPIKKKFLLIIVGVYWGFIVWFS